MDDTTKIISEEEINTFLEGHNPQERIVNLDYNYQNDFMTVIYRDELDRKCKQNDPFYPFLWATKEGCQKLCGGDRACIKQLLGEYNIECKALRVTNNKGVVCQSMLNGYTILFRAKTAMSYSRFLKFFDDAGVSVYSKDNDTSSKQNFLTVTPQEQYLIYTGKRFFKGYDDYNQLLRMIFDLETEGLDPVTDRIEWFGIRFNRPITYKGVTKEYSIELELKGESKAELDNNELKLIDTALRIIYTFKPDIITAHNGENFDWSFIIERCKQLGSSIEHMSAKYFNGKSIAKNTRESVLKLGGEMEHFYRTIVPETIITDSLHAVRRAQATDSNFLKADLKYATKYLDMVKPNRVYIPGNMISKISNDYVERYAFNDDNGDWYIYDENYTPKETQPKQNVIVKQEFENSLFPVETKITTKVENTPQTDRFIVKTKNTLDKGYVLVNGHYIVERYLADDLWECDKVEYALNSTDFMLAKIIPVPFQKVVTMGTAGQWKAIMMAWSYENNLAIPKAENTGAFTGGLSRLLRVGSVENIVKLDYNSLYPSIILTWGISDETDLMDAMLHMLKYVLTTREKHKALKKAAGKKVDAFEARLNNGETLSPEELAEYNEQLNTYKVEDNRQAVVKKLGNSFFGSYGSNNGSVFPWKSLKCAERTTCTGRQSLRLMISHFKELGYQPIVGDSFTEDTPVFIKYKDGEKFRGWIDIKPISELINEKEVKIDELGREYDYSEKPYVVLSRTGWVEPKYIYRHKTNKDIYEVVDGDTRIEVTEDHSLFNSNQEKLKPSEITEDTKLEYYIGKIDSIDSAPNQFASRLVYEAVTNHVPNYYYNLGKNLANNEKYANYPEDRVPFGVLNSYREARKEFYRGFMENYREDIEYSKTCLAGLQFLKKSIIF